MDYSVAALKPSKEAKTVLKQSKPALSILRGRVRFVILYEILDYELDILSKGSHCGLLLNFAVLFLTVGISFTISLLSADISSVYTYIFFVLAAFVGFSVGGILLSLWWQSRKSVSKIIDRIKKRLRNSDNDN